MTEEKAKTKWCPFTRVNLGCEVGNATVNRGFNGGSTNHINTRCIGSDCMAWQATDHEYAPQPPEYTGPNEPAPSGYCGLAGKP